MGIRSTLRAERPEPIEGLFELQLEDGPPQVSATGTRKARLFRHGAEPGPRSFENDRLRRDRCDRVAITFRIAMV